MGCKLSAPLHLPHCWIMPSGQIPAAVFARLASSFWDCYFTLGAPPPSTSSSLLRLETNFPGLNSPCAKAQYVTNFLTVGFISHLFVNCRMYRVCSVQVGWKFTISIHQLQLSSHWILLENFRNLPPCWHIYTQFSAACLNSWLFFTMLFFCRAQKCIIPVFWSKISY